MALPVRSLPLVQNWDCHGCTECCREYVVPITEEERQRILAQGWDQDPDIGDLPLFVRIGGWFSRRYRLNQLAGGRCIFLSDRGRCRIHERFGADAKPLTCRLYPFVLVPAGDHWRVGIRFACPSAANQQGRPLAEHSEGLRHLAAELEQRDPQTRQSPAPPLQSRQQLGWSDLQHITQALSNLLSDSKDRIERRVRKCLGLAELCRRAKFDKVSGPRLVEFLRLIGQSLESDVPRDPATVPAPTWVGRSLFRMALALYIRKDSGSNLGLAARGRVALFGAAWRFARGQGPVPKMNGLIPDVTFEQIEQPAGPLSDSGERLLERFYQVKVDSLQFCGRNNFGMQYWEGLEALALTLPAILWLYRAFANQPRDEALVNAIRLVDSNFSYNPLLGRRRLRWNLSILARQGEIAKLIAWYSR